MNDEVVTNPVSPCVPRELAAESERVNMLLSREGVLDYLDDLCRASGGKLNRSLIVRGMVSAFAERGLRMPGARSEESVREIVGRHLDAGRRLDAYARPLAATTPSPRVSTASAPSGVNPRNTAGKSDSCRELDQLLERRCLGNPHLPTPVGGNGGRP